MGEQLSALKKGRIGVMPAGGGAGGFDLTTGDETERQKIEKQERKYLPTRNGLQPTSDGLQPSSDGLQSRKEVSTMSCKEQTCRDIYIIYI